MKSTMGPRARVVRRQRSSAARAARPLKIVVTGPFAAGKTTLIKTISEVAIVERLGASTLGGAVAIAGVAKAHSIPRALHLRID